MNKHFFTIEGDRLSGKYTVTEYANGNSVKIFESIERHNGGLKEARQMIGEHLKKSGYPMNKVFSHQCIKEGRRNNPVHEWTVNEYLTGIPL